MNKMASRPKQRNAFRDKYLAAIIAVAAFMISFNINGQVRQKINAYGYDWKRGGFDTSLTIPRDTPHLANTDTGSIAIKNGWLYQYKLISGVYKWDSVVKAFNEISYTETDPLFNSKFATKTTSDLVEGINLYYTNARARAALSATAPISYNNSTGVFTWSGNTTDVPEGSNLYYTDARARASLSSSNSLLTYNNSTGVFGLGFTTADTLRWGSGSGSGTVTNFSSGNLSPLFTTSVSNATSTPDLSFSLSNASAYTVFGNNTGSSATPSYYSPVLSSALFANQGTATTVLHGNASGNPSWGAVNLASDVTGSLPNANLANSTIGLSLGTSGSDVNVSGSPAALGSSLTLNIPDAGLSARGLTTTSAQSFAGEKTFRDNIVLDNLTGSGNNTRLFNPKNVSNFSQISFYPSTVNTNSNTTFSVIPKGTGTSGNVSQFLLFGTDYVANSSNYEIGGMRATGTSYVLATGSNGSGSNRALILSAGLLRDGVTNDNQIRLHTSGNVSINSSSDGGFRLDVNGSIRSHQMFSGANFFRDQIYMTATTNGYTAQNSYNASSAYTLGFVGDLRFASQTSIKSVFSFNGMYSNNGTAYDGDLSLVRIFTTDAMGNSSNTPGINGYGIHISPIYNYTQSTSTATGIYYNPTLTSTTGLTHRSIHTVTGDALFGTTSGRVGIGVNTSIHSSAIVDITSTTQGFLQPRQTTTQRNAISSPATGLFVYDSTINAESYYNGTAWLRNAATNDVTPSAGQLPLGNGSNYTVTSFGSIASVSTTSGVSPTSPMGTYLVDASGGDVTLTITAAFSGQIINIKRVDASINTVTIQMNSGNIDGAASINVVGQYTSRQIQWDGSNAYVL
jgi:hypothetical protein